MSKKAIDARRWRATATGQRRFNKVLNAYVQTMYKDIYNQAKTMYNSLNEKYPNKHDLTKTTEFRTWKITISETWKTWEKTTQTDGEETTTADEGQTDEDVEIQVREHKNDTERAINDIIQDLGLVDEEQTTSAGENVEIQAREHENDMERVVNDIIQDLQMDEDLQNYLNDNDFVQPQYAYDDEGIGLNVELELEDIIEPLDLEEEGFFF